jgi:hypothetical protein
MTWDDDTLESLGYAHGEREDEQSKRASSMHVVREREAGFADRIDGRHRRNWRHRETHHVSDGATQLEPRP